MTRPVLPLLSGPHRVKGVLPRGVNTPLLIEDNTKRLWVRKDVERMGLSGEGLRAEVLCWLLGRHAGVPIPDAALWRSVDTEVAWMSAYIDGALAWDPLEVELYDRADMGAIPALDVVLLNRDRNPSNLFIEASLERPLSVWAIDHERAGVADLAFLREHRDATLDELPGFKPSSAQPGGLPHAAIRPAALATASRFAELTEADIQQALVEALAVSGYAGEDAEEWTALLLGRCLSAPERVTRYLSTQGG